MNAIENCIREAVENGWKPEYEYRWERSGQPLLHGGNIFLDPLFWSALGKARGWKRYTWQSYADYRRDHLNRLEHTDDEECSPDTVGEWKYAVRYITFEWHWHRFIDHLAFGQDAESFFATLI